MEVENVNFMPNSFVQIGERDLFFLKPEICIGELAFLKGRPMLAIAVEERVAMSSVISVSLGSKGNEPGIAVHMQFPRSSEFLGNHETTFVHPWAVFSFSTSQIQLPLIGKLKKEIFKEVKHCLAYHLGFSDDVPPYLNDRQYPIEYHSGYWNGQGVVTCNKARRPITDPSRPAISAGNGPGSGACINAPLAKVQQSVPEVKRPVVTPVTETGGAVRPFAYSPQLSASMEKLIKEIPEGELVRFLGRGYTLIEFSNKYDHSTSYMNVVRRGLEKKYVTKEAYSTIRDKLWHNPGNMKFLSPWQEVTFACFMTPDMAGMTPTLYAEKQKQIYTKYGLSDAPNRWRNRDDVMEQALPGCTTRKFIAREKQLIFEN